MIVFSYYFLSLGGDETLFHNYAVPMQIIYIIDCMLNKKNNTRLQEHFQIQQRQNRYSATHIDDRSLSWIGTDTLIKCGGVKLVTLIQTFPHCKMVFYTCG
jgi:hypothetical protein